MERFQVVVVGGGQAGLAAAHELERRGVTFVVLEAADRVGDQWRKRWDSLRLFTPARFDALPGSEFPAPPASFPAKDEVAGYLEAYSRKGRLPVRTGVRALKLERGEASYRLETSAGTVEADHVVIATGYSKPRIPQFAVQLNPDIIFTHTAPGVLAAKQATTTIPIVVIADGLVDQGIVASLDRPGGNITGTTTFGAEMYGKQLELLKEAAPHIARVAVMVNAANPGSDRYPAILAAEARLKLAVTSIHVFFIARLRRRPNPSRGQFRAGAVR